MIQRFVLLSAAALLCASGAFAQCRSSQGYPDSAHDATTYKNDLNLDLSDYGVIFEEAAPWSGCAQAAADALYKKIYTTMHPDLVSQPAWPHHDSQVCPRSTDDPNYYCMNPYQGWLGGGDAALIYSSALRLANVGKLTKPLDDLIKSIDYRFNKDLYCGFDGLIHSNNYGDNTPRWRDQNSCMDDYTVGAMGLGWLAAYRAKRGYGDAVTPANDSKAAASNSLSWVDSVCVWNGALHLNSPSSRGPCMGNTNDLMMGSMPMSLHGGDAQPYGLGLFTSLASAAVALKVANPSSPMSLSSDEQFVVQQLYNHARSYTASDQSSFARYCYRFTYDPSTGAMDATPDYWCGNPSPEYTPTMFPVKDWIAQYAPPAQPAPSFDTFDSSLFCDTSVGNNVQGIACSFFSPGRRAVYGQMAQTWTTNPPSFTNTGLGDYTVTLRTYNGNYLSATNGGGSSVNASPTSVGTNEQFSLVIRTANETQLNDGDQITLQSTGSSNAQWLTAESGGGAGSALDANRIYPASWETFTIHKLNGTGAINAGDPVALSSANGYYVSAANGGGSSVTVDRTSAQAWETFTVGLTHN